MAGSYLGHGAKYWADRYFESQSQTRLPDDSADLNWREKYIALEKECSAYQGTLSDMRVEIENLRSRHPAVAIPDLELQHEAQKWRNAYWKLYDTLKKKEIQYDALSAEKYRIERQLQLSIKESLPYQGKTAEQWAQLYLSEQRSHQDATVTLEKKNSEIQSLNSIIVDYQKANDIDGHDAIYWHHKFTSLQKDFLSHRLLLVFIIFFFSFSSGAVWGHSIVEERPLSSQNSSSIVSAFTDNLGRPETGLVHSISNQEELAPFMVKTPIDRCYYLRLCQDNQVIASYFIRPGEMLAVHVPLGSYTVYYAFSSQSAPWISEQELWGSHTVYYKFRDKFDFCRDGDTYQGRNIDFANLNYYKVKSMLKADWLKFN